MRDRKVGDSPQPAALEGVKEMGRVDGKHLQETWRQV
jgi:hypothetical protein